MRRADRAKLKKLLPRTFGAAHVITNVVQRIGKDKGGAGSKPRRAKRI